MRSPTDEYALVLVDEAHNYRNPDAPARATILRQLLMGQHRDLVLMSATPVNNSLWDLYHVLRYFVKQDAVLADHGVLSIRERFEDAMREDPFNLNPDLLYPIIDATTVKRTRQFIKKHYENDLIRLRDGSRVPIRFPKPVASSINYDLDDVLPGFLAEVEQALMPPNGQPCLTMARYQPEHYPAGEPRGEAGFGTGRADSVGSVEALRIVGTRVRRDDGEDGAGTRHVPARAGSGRNHPQRADARAIGRRR